MNHFFKESFWKSLFYCTGLVILNSTFSFITAASMHYPITPMVLTILSFSLGYALFTQTTFFKFIKSNEQFYKSAIIGYIINAIIIPVHLYAGVGSVSIVEHFLFSSKTFIATFFVSTIQGVILNGTAVIIIAIMYYFLRICNNYKKFKTLHMAK